LNIADALEQALAQAGSVGTMIARCFYRRILPYQIRECRFGQGKKSHHGHISMFN
jgi:hypothetical protein